MFKHTLCTLAMAALVAPAMAADENWTTDLPAALKQAGQEAKLVLVDFNGSDWCGPCITLKTKVFDSPEFLEYAKDKFILVDVDLPQGNKISEEQKKINSALAEEFSVEGFPTILVLNADGYALGGFVGGRSSIENTVVDLNEAIANADKYSAAASLEGAAKAKALYEAHKAIAPSANPRLIKAVIELDAEDVTGLRADQEAKAKVEARMLEIQGRMQEAAQDPKSLLEIVNKELTADDLPTEGRAFLLNMKSQIMLTLADSIDELMAAKAVLLECATYDAEYADEAKAQIEEMFASPEELLERVREFRSQKGIE